MRLDRSTIDGSRERSTIAVLRMALLGLFVIGTVGVGTELLLIDHTEELWQLIPLILMASGLFTVAWTRISKTGRSIRYFQVIMGLFVMSGVLGLFLHYRGNAEFELEMYPSMHGFTLFWESIRGATPVLGPGTMIELGLLGLAYTYRHPIFRAAENKKSPRSES